MKVIVTAIFVLMSAIAAADSPVADGPECIRAREEYAKREALKAQKRPGPVKQNIASRHP